MTRLHHFVVVATCDDKGVVRFRLDDAGAWLAYPRGTVFDGSAWRAAFDSPELEQENRDAWQRLAERVEHVDAAT